MEWGGGTLDQIQPLGAAKGQEAVKRRGAGNPAIVAPLSKNGRSKERIAHERKRAGNRGQRRAGTAARGATMETVFACH